MADKTPSRSAAVGCAAALLAVLAMPGGCNRPRPDAAEKPVRPLRVYFSEAGQNGPFPLPLRMVIHDPGTLAWARLSHLPVDFTSQMVLLACMGRVPARGYRIRIQGVWEQGRRVYVDVRTFPPKDRSAPGSVRPAQPYHAVVVDRSDYNVDGFTAQIPRLRAP